MELKRKIRFFLGVNCQSKASANQINQEMGSRLELIFQEKHPMKFLGTREIWIKPISAGMCVLDDLKRNHYSLGYLLIPCLINYIFGAKTTYNFWYYLLESNKDHRDSCLISM